MNTLQLVLLAIIQGLSEFLPVSSSAHLILPSHLFDLPDQGLAFDIAVHVGTLVAVLIYLRRELYQLSTCWFRSVTGGVPSAESRLVWFLVIGTVPVGLGGLLFNDVVELHLRSVAVIATTTILFALALAVADKKGAHRRKMESLTAKDALVIGLAQMVALIPGTSRSGITMTAALALGFERRDAARYSFLLAIPVIALSGGYQALKLGTEVAAPWGSLCLGAVIAGITALLCIHFFLTLIDRIGMMPFVWYRLALGALLIVILLRGGA